MESRRPESAISRSCDGPEKEDGRSKESETTGGAEDPASTGDAKASMFEALLRKDGNDGDDDDDDKPPLPDEAPPGNLAADDGWQPVWDHGSQAYYFFNRFTNLTTWTNPRVPEVVATEAARGAAASVMAPGLGGHERRNVEEGEMVAAATAAGVEEEDGLSQLPRPPARPHGGYDPSIHGDYDPTADYARRGQGEGYVGGGGEEEVAAAAAAAEGDGEDTAAGAAGSEGVYYTAAGSFNRFTGKWQAAELAPENFNDEHKSRRQMTAFFDVDAAANSHDGKSLKAERSGKKLSKKEVKAFKDKRREKKEEKRRAWLRD